MKKYSDYIQLQSFLPVYDILQENDNNSWKSFIPTRQFNDLVRHALTAFTSTELSKRKSMWVRGTFGTGKSHASAVVKHLLCDEYSNVKSYIDNIQDSQLRQKLHSMRTNGKKYFAVTLKGVEKAYDIPRFTLSLQRETQKALQKVAPNFNVPSDFVTASNWIKSHTRIFEEDILAKDEELQTVVGSIDDVITELGKYNTSIYLAVDKAVRQHVGDVFQHASISEWLVEVEQEIEKQKIADGLIIFWDEFTSVMDTLKSDRINVLQNIAEKSQNHNVFLYLISHRVEAQNQDARSKDITKMSDRFDEMEYTMDTLSTYLIMRHSFTIASENLTAYETVKANALHSLDNVLTYLCDYNSEEKNHIKSLFPLHPYTAFLCSTISNHIGSSNRSVVKFMHDESDGFAAFIDDENNAVQGMLMTADSLWDFFYDEFRKDTNNTTFTSVYTSFEGKVKAMGNDYLRVFKAILLLNVLGVKFKGDIQKLIPDEQTLSMVFAGDKITAKLADILTYFNDNDIVARNIFGQYKLSANSYNATEKSNAKTKAESTYKLSTDIIDYNIEAKESINDLFRIGVSMRRECCFQLYSCEESESVLKSKLNKLTSSKPNYLHIGFFTSIDDASRDEKINVIKELSSDYSDSILILTEETFSRDFYNKFIDAIATSEVANNHFNTAESKELERNAKAFVEKWIERLMNGPYTLFFNGKPYNEGAVSQVPELIKRKISGKIFTSGFEAVKAYCSGGSDTFYVDKNCPNTILKILEATTRDGLIKHASSQIPIKEIFSDDNGNSLITLSGELSELALNSNAWLVQVCRQMDKCMSEAREKYNDRFSLSEILASFIQPPFGFFTSYANCAALAYAIRKHKGDLFMPGISQPVSDDKLGDMLVELFKMWKEGKSEHSNKLLLRFGSPEESKLTNLLVELFELAKVNSVNTKEIKSLANAKWGIEEFCKKVSKYPLWTLAHKPGISADLKEAVLRIIELFSVENPSVDKIKAIYKTLESNRIELSTLLTRPSHYEAGFRSFVDSIEEVKIQPEWWDEMMEEVNTLPSEIAFRKEPDVRQKIVSFYIRKIQPEPKPQKDDNDPNKPIQPGNTAADYVKEARDKVKTTNMPNMMWQQVMLELINEYPNVAEFIGKYLS